MQSPEEQKYVGYIVKRRRIIYNVFNNQYFSVTFWMIIAFVLLNEMTDLLAIQARLSIWCFHPIGVVNGY